MGSKATPDNNILSKLTLYIEKKIKSCRIRVDCLFKDEGYFERQMLVPHMQEIYNMARYREILGLYLDLAEKLNLKFVYKHFKGNEGKFEAGMDSVPINVLGLMKVAKSSKERNYGDKGMTRIIVENSKQEIKNNDSKDFCRSKTFDKLPVDLSKQSNDCFSQKRRISLAHERKNHFFDEFIKNPQKDEQKHTTKKLKPSKDSKTVENDPKNSKFKRISVQLQPPKTKSRFIKKTFAENLILKKQRNISKDVININKMNAETLKLLNIKKEYTKNEFVTPKLKNIVIEDEFENDEGFCEFVISGDNHMSIKFADICGDNK